MNTGIRSPGWLRGPGVPSGFGNRNSGQLQVPGVPVDSGKPCDSAYPEFLLTPGLRSSGWLREPGVAGDSTLEPGWLREYRWLREPGVTRNPERVPEFTPGSRSHPGFLESYGSPVFRIHPDIYIYFNLRNNFGYGQFLRNKLHVHNKFDTSTVKLRITLRHNNYVRCAHGVMCVTLYLTYWHLVAGIGNTCRYFGDSAFRCLWCICLFCTRKMSGSLQNREVNIPQFWPELHLSLSAILISVFPSIWTLPHFLMSFIVHTLFFCLALWPWNINRYLRGQRTPPALFMDSCFQNACRQPVKD